MNINEYINLKKEIQVLLLNYLDEQSSSSDESFHSFINVLEMQNFSENTEELTLFLHLLNKITKNHHRNTEFFNKIDKIFLYLQDDIKNTISHEDLYEIFSKNNRILLLLYNHNFLPTECQKYLEGRYSQYNYFLPEIKSFIPKYYEINYNTIINDKYEEKRLIGENDSYLCYLIRNDLVEEFITYINKNNINHSNQISPSYFETNSFLIKRTPTLIEYAAFFGSIQIFKYLQFNKVKLESSLWLYAIHSNNAEMINLLEEFEIEPEDKTYKKCYEEAIKCHHNDIASYIINNLIDPKDEIENTKKNYRENMNSFCFQHYNYYFFPEEFDDKYIFYYSCEYDYFNIVKLLFQAKEINLKEKIISPLILLMKQFQFLSKL